MTNQPDIPSGEPRSAQKQARIPAHTLEIVSIELGEGREGRERRGGERSWEEGGRDPIK